jgi:hypothetical protein
MAGIDLRRDIRQQGSVVAVVVVFLAVGEVLSQGPNSFTVLPYPIDPYRPGIARFYS